MNSETSSIDHRLMAACLRYARRHRGLTGTNPSVGTLLVQFENENAIVVGRGVTERGGRPHAERAAIDQAGERSKGSTAYVSLEPCAHHGVTPPCAEALIRAGVARVVTAWTDPDARVDGKGHQILRDAGVDVSVGCHAKTAEQDLAGYLNRKQYNRPQVILKLAVSADGKLGLPGEEVKVTGDVARNYVHRLRAECDAILIGRGTVEADDPELTCRLPGLNHRSPSRFVLDSTASLAAGSKLAQSARKTPTFVVTSLAELPTPLFDLGVNHFAGDHYEGQLALPELLEDMSSAGISSLMVEGGAKVARSFLEANWVDEIVLLSSPNEIGASGIVSPITLDSIPKEFGLARTMVLADDELRIYRKK